MMRAAAMVGLGLVVVLGSGCTKVPLIPVNASFTLADATWFEEEHTLFVFTELEAEQGLGDHSVVEIRYTTDSQEVDWTPVFELPTVHTHVPVDCGPNARCGSASILVTEPPRDIGLRLRYHRDGELALEANAVYNHVTPGPDFRQRSLLVYGVFDETNRRVQWRSRHQFPTVRNKQAQDLGLRREVIIEGQHYGNEFDAPGASNPYKYNGSCSGNTDLGFAPLFFDERARFEPQTLPLEASGSVAVCAESTVFDGLGTFSAGVVARKNPEVRPAFPVLRSPIREATQIPFFLGPCTRVISPEHEGMQRQRMGMEGVPTTCIEGWNQQAWADDLNARFRSAIETERAAGNDMVLTVAIHHDDDGLSEVVEDVLASVVPPERLRNSPRVAGAFVLDSDAYALQRADNANSVLWCPAELSLTDPYNVQSLPCAVMPDDPSLNLGPLSFTILPILPTREEYDTFLETYSVAQAGEMESLTFRVPEFATTADHVGFGIFGAATFLNNETIGAQPDDAFSVCIQDVPAAYFVFRAPSLMPGAFDFYDCTYLLGLDESSCTLLTAGVGPIELLPLWHNLLGEATYDLGLAWDFPFLLRMDYQASVAGALSAFGLSVPFGLENPAEAFFGADLWLDEEFSLDPLLTQCDRFCDHPTFDSAGVYQPVEDFRTSYELSCYQPSFPEVGDDGYPLDP